MCFSDKHWSKKLVVSVFSSFIHVYIDSFLLFSMVVLMPRTYRVVGKHQWC